MLPTLAPSVTDTPFLFRMGKPRAELNADVVAWLSVANNRDFTASVYVVTVASTMMEAAMMFSSMSSGTTLPPAPCPPALRKAASFALKLELSKLSMLDSISSVSFTRNGESDAAGKAADVAFRPDARELFSDAPAQLVGTPRQQTAPQHVEPMRAMLSN